jgi:hypothetical protein
LQTANPETRYLINEIVLAEESDLTFDGKRSSHYEMYIEAMKACKCKYSRYRRILNEVDSLKTSLRHD